MTNILTSGAALNAGGQLTSPNGRYVLTMQTNGVLALQDTSTTPNTNLFSSPTQGQPNVVCTMATNGVLKLSIGPLSSGNVICISTNLPSFSSGACLFLENDGVARIRQHCTAAGADLWDTTQQMKLTIGAQFRALAFSFDNLDQEVQGLTEEVFQLRKAQHHRDGKDFDEQEHGSGTKPRATGAGGKTGS